MAEFSHHATQLEFSWGGGFVLDDETQLLGALMLDPKLSRLISSLLRAEDFTSEVHRVLFSAMEWLVAGSVAVDVNTVAEALRLRGDLARVGGIPFLAWLTRAVAHAGHAERYAATAHGRACSAPDGSPTPIPLKSELKTAFEFFENSGEGQRSTPPVVPSGFPALDGLHREGFLHPGELVAIAGVDGNETSAFARVVARAAAAAEIPTLFFSPVVSAQRLAFELIADESDVASERLRSTLLRDRDWPRLTRAAGALAELPILIDDTPDVSAADLQTRLLRLNAQVEKKIGMLVVDGAQFVGPAGMESCGEGGISRFLKRIAREGNTVVFATFPLPAPAHGTLWDLRQAGIIEKEADTIFVIGSPPDSGDRHTQEAEDPMVLVRLERLRGRAAGGTALVPRKGGWTTNDKEIELRSLALRSWANIGQPRRGGDG